MGPTNKLYLLVADVILGKNSPKNTEKYVVEAGNLSNASINFKDWFTKNYPEGYHEVMRVELITDFNGHFIQAPDKE